MAKKLTAMQADFVKGLTRGLRPAEAAEQAGSLSPGAAAHSWLRNSRVLEAIHTGRNSRIQGELAHLALETMRDLMGIKHAPAATRFQAAQWVLKQAGHDGTPGDQAEQRKDLSDMDAAELAEAVQSGRQALEGLAASLQGHHVIEGQVRQLRDLEPAPLDAEDLSFLD